MDLHFLIENCGNGREYLNEQIQVEMGEPQKKEFCKNNDLFKSSKRL